MVEALSLDGDEHVLEVGTGCGWQTALLAELARQVFSVERFADLAETARANLGARENVHIVVGDGSGGCRSTRRSTRFSSRPPTGACRGRSPHSSPKQAGSCSRSGRVAPRRFVLFEKRRGALQRTRSLGGAHFVRMYGRHGFA
jgi:protein-L-isoaspartate(D-aspartate) O-methyltransferase